VRYRRSFRRCERSKETRRQQTLARWGIGYAENARRSRERSLIRQHRRQHRAPSQPEGCRFSQRLQKPSQHSLLSFRGLHAVSRLPKPAGRRVAHPRPGGHQVDTLIWRP